MGLIKDGSFLSQKELADLIGVSRRTLINWESGESPTPKHQKRICLIIKDKLNFSINEKILMEKDLSSIIGPLTLYINSDLTSKLTPEQRRLIQYLFLKIENLSEETLKAVISKVDEVLSEGQ